MTVVETNVVGDDENTIYRRIHKNKRHNWRNFLGVDCLDKKRQAALPPSWLLTPQEPFSQNFPKLVPLLNINKSLQCTANYEKNVLSIMVVLILGPLGCLGSIF